MPGLVPGLKDWRATNEKKLFISPPVDGWILVIGSALPDPAADVDACFRFVMELSRKLGHVQFFSANRVLSHHAWVQVEAGRVRRAYAWAGTTLWKQGLKTTAEADLGLKCFDYFETAERTSFGRRTRSSPTWKKSLCWPPAGASIRPASTSGSSNTPAASPANPRGSGDFESCAGRPLGANWGKLNPGD